MSGTSRRWAGLVLVGAVAAVGVPGPAAAAAPVERGSFEDAFTEEQEDFCGVEGLDVVLTGVFSGQYRVDARRGTLFFHQTSRLTRTVTNPATGLSASDTATVLEQDLRVTQHPDGTATILVLATGNATLKDSTGRTVARDPGQTRFEILVDLAGTPLDPSDDEFLEFLGVVKESTGRTDDFCAASVAAIT